MKILYAHFLLFTIILFSANFSHAQQLCEEPAEELEEAACEGCSAGEGEADVSADIGGESGEMALEEADMMGTEVAEAGAEAAAEAGAEVGLEIGTEALAATSFLDVIPGVGEVVMAAVFVATVIMEIFEAEHLRRLKHLAAVREEQRLAHRLSGGVYHFPIFPSFAASVDDLDGSRDTVSYMFFLKKDVGTSEVRNYLKSMGDGASKHIGKPYDVKKFNDHMAYAFSQFTGVHTYGKSKIPFTYKRSVVPISLRQSNGAWSYSYQATWRHVVKYNSIEGTRNSTTHPWTENKYHLNASYTTRLNAPLQFWLATKDTNGSFRYLAQVPTNKIHIEDHQGQAAVRIKKLNIAPYSGNGELYITLRTRYKNNYIVKHTIGDTTRLFPENWNPTQGGLNFSHNEYTYTPIPSRRVVRSKTRRYDTAFRQPEDLSLYPNSRGKHPDNRDGNLFYFRVHDYQPKDNAKSIAKKDAVGKQKEINLFPQMHTLGKVECKEGSISPPDRGRLNLLMTLPRYIISPKNINVRASKTISYIELEDLKRRHTVVIKVDNYTSEQCRVSAHYNTKTTKAHAIKVKPIRVINGQWHADTDNIVRFLTERVARKNGTFVLENVLFSPGDIVNLSAYYSDGSLCRDVVVLKDVPNNPAVLPRAYYTLNVHGTQDYLNRSTTLRFPAQPNSVDISSGRSTPWLVEYQGHNTYAVMHKESKKLLGMVNGNVGLYDWKPADLSLRWVFDFLPNGSTRLINLGQKAYLSTFSPNSKRLIFNFKQGSHFVLNKVSEAEAILSTNYSYISSVSNGKTLQKTTAIQPVLAAVDKSISAKQTHYLKYQGCLRYVVYNQASKRYLNLIGNDLQWTNKSKTTWFLPKVGAHYLMKTASGRMLYPASSAGNILSLSHSDSATTIRARHKWLINDRISTSDLIAHYRLDGNAKNSSDYPFGDGTAKNGVTYVKDTARGQVAQFDGINDYIDTHFDYHPLNYARNLTVSCWMKTKHWGAPRARLMEANAWSIARSKPESRPKDTTGLGLYTYHVSSDPNYWTSASTLNLMDNQWHHVLIIIKPNRPTGVKTEVYVDSVKRYSRSITLPLRKSLGISTVIGKSVGKHNDYYKGYLDDIKIWKKALSASELQAEYRATKKGKSTTPTKRPYVITRGYYKIINRASGKALTMNDNRASVKSSLNDDPIAREASGISTRDNVIQHTYAKDTIYNDEWLIDPMQNGNYVITNRKHHQKALDISYFRAYREGSNVQANALDHAFRNASQQWKLMPSTAGTYQIQNVGLKTANRFNRCLGLDISYLETSDYLNIAQHTCRSQTQRGHMKQQFFITFVAEALPAARRISGSRLASTTEGKAKTKTTRSLVIHPNPTQGTVHITTPRSSEPSTQVQISIRDLVGKTLYTSQKTLAKEAQTLTLQLKQLGIRTGIYLLNVKTGKKEMQEKLMLK